AASAAFGTSTLDDELGDDAVKREPVVIAVAREPDEIVDRVRRELRVEIHHDHTTIGRDGRPVDLAGFGLRFGLLRHDGSPCGQVWGQLGFWVVGVVRAAFSASASTASTWERSGLVSSVSRRNCWKDGMASRASCSKSNRITPF